VGFGKLLEGLELMEISMVDQFDEGIFGVNGVAGLVPLRFDKRGLLGSVLNSLVLQDNLSLGGSMRNDLGLDSDSERNSYESKLHII